MVATEAEQVLLLGSGRLRAKICRYGASVMSLTFPDKTGKERDIVLGFDSPVDYLERNSPYFGCVVGRVANRIAGAKFDLDGVTFNLSANEDGPKTLHGGKQGLSRQLWTVDEATRTDTSVTLTLLSPDGDQGFPGDVEFSVKYSLPSDKELQIEMLGRPLNKRTPISLAHHTYWNLCGHDQGTILGHQLKLSASEYTPVGPTQIPTGEVLPVSGTPFDFRNPTPIGSRIGSVPGGYDHNFIVDTSAAATGTLSAEGLTLAPVARASCALSGISLELHASAPGVQFYTGNFLDGSVAGKGGCLYQQHSGFCLETQGFPNAVNEPKFSSIVVSPGETYKHIMHLSFSR